MLLTTLYQVVRVRPSETIKIDPKPCWATVVISLPEDYTQRLAKAAACKVQESRVLMEEPQPT